MFLSVIKESFCHYMIYIFQLYFQYPHLMSIPWRLGGKREFNDDIVVNDAD